MPRHVLAVDLDRTLAKHFRFTTEEAIGQPIPGVVERVKRAHKRKVTIYIFTARLAPQHGSDSIYRSTVAIGKWCLQHLGFVPLMTCIKLPIFTEIWDDRTISIKANEGEGVTLNEGSLWDELAEDENEFAFYPKP